MQPCIAGTLSGVPAAYLPMQPSRRGCGAGLEKIGWICGIRPGLTRGSTRAGMEFPPR